MGSSSFGDSNSFEEVFKAEERRFRGALFSGAPKATNVELFYDNNWQRLFPKDSIWARFEKFGNGRFYHPSSLVLALKHHASTCHRDAMSGRMKEDYLALLQHLAGIQ